MFCILLQNLGKRSGKTIYLSKDTRVKLRARAYKISILLTVLWSPNTKASPKEFNLTTRMDVSANQSAV